MWTQNILNGLINFLSPVIGIAIVCFCVYQGFNIFKGNQAGSWKKLAGGVVLLLFILGIMTAAGSWQNYANMFSNTTNTIIDKGQESLTGIMNGTTGTAPEAGGR